jgi:hypothetical protein
MIIHVHVYAEVKTEQTTGIEIKAK